MSQLGDAFVTALHLLTSLDCELAQIVLLSLRISLSAVALAVLIGMPLGAALALARFPGRGALVGCSMPAWACPRSWSGCSSI
jgi:tungstate transport system permease protein